MSINFSDGLEDQAMVTSSSVLPEDAGEGSLRPKTISEYIGQEEVSSLVDYLLLPKEIQQEETKKRGHGAEQALALVLHKIGVSFIPDRRHENPMSQDDQNVDKVTFDLAPRDEKKT